MVWSRGYARFVRIRAVSAVVLTANPPTAAEPAVIEKPLLRGWMHLAWCELSLVVGTLLVVNVAARDRVGAAIYAVAVSGLFGASALYHRGRWRPVIRRLLQRCDHAMIFVLIAGTATPIFLVTLPRPLSVIFLAVMWSLTGLMLITHLIWMNAPEWLVGGTYIGLGCLAGVALPAVWIHSGVAPFVLLASGGVLYIAGALMYHTRRPDPWPSVFGFHETFHTFVCAAATAQFVAIACFIL
jgi:hemolysin III